MKNLLLAILAFFMMFLGTAYAGALPTMQPVDVTNDWYVSGDEPVIDPSNGYVYTSSLVCVEPADLTDEWYCNQTEGCPMCVVMEQGLTKGPVEKFVPQDEKPKYIEDDFGWYS